MADPLSVAASILTLLSAGGAVGKFLKKAIALKKAPEILLALNNDVADIHQIVHDVDELLQEHSSMVDTAPLGHVCESLEKVKKTLSIFEHIISYQLTSVERDGSYLRLDRSAWLRAEPKIVKLREGIRADKGDLCLSLTLLTNFNSLQGVNQSRTLQTAVTDLHDHVLRTAGTIFSQLQVMESTLRIASEEQREQGTSLHLIRESIAQDHQNGRSLSTQVQSVKELLRKMSYLQVQEVEPGVIQYRERYDEAFHRPRAEGTCLTQSSDHHSPQSESPSELEERQFHSNLNPTSVVPRFPSRESEGYGQPPFVPHFKGNPATAESLSYTTPIKLMHNRCDSACCCICHRRCQLKSPRSLNALLGSLFVGYQTSPWSAQTCSNSDCRRRSKKLTYVYAFPRWFLARILLINVAYDQSKGPELNLRVMRVRPSNTGIFWWLRYKGHDEESMVNYMKRLLSDGEVSVLDVDPQGYTILHLAVCYGLFRLTELLIRCGADLYYQNTWGQSAFFGACESFLTFPELVEREAFIWQSLSDQSQLDLLGLSELHKAYLGLSGVTYHMDLSVTPRSRIDEMDMAGRTTLSWACQKGDDTTVAELLSCGADPNTTDIQGISPLHYASISSSKTCVRLLLASKAVLEAKDRYGNTPLALAARTDGEEISILLEFGADMETQAKFSCRPMHQAVMFDCPQNVIHLLHAGADMFTRTSAGYTTLDFAIDRNAHSTLTVLLEAQGLSTRPTDDVWSAVDMCLAAWYADQKTLEILHSAVLEGFHLRLVSEDWTKAEVIQMAKYRRDYNQEWSEIALLRCDANPIAWYQSFKLLFGAVRRSQSGISEEIDDEYDSQLDYGTGEESSDNGSVGGDDSQLDYGTGKESSDTESADEESWEDAPESQGEL